MKNISFIFIFVVLFSCKEEKHKSLNIYIASIVEIEPIKELREGFIETLNDSFATNSDSLIFKEFNAQGDEALVNQIIDEIIVDKPDLVYVLGTSFSQGIQKRDTSILIVQGAATDPVSADLADNWEGSGRNYAANSDLPPLDLQVALISKLIPNSKKIGVMYNSGESNSIAVLKRLRPICKKYNLDLIEKSISNVSELNRVTESFIDEVDALYIPPDNTVHSNFEIVGKICNENGIPLFATTSETIDAGALAALSLDFKILGQEAGRIAFDILTGKVNISKVPIKTTDNPKILINKNLLNIYSELDESVIKNLGYELK